MRGLSLVTTFAATALAASANASVVTVGGGFAESCYRAADGQTAKASELDACNQALAQQALTSEDKVATYVNRGILHLRRVNLDLANVDFDKAIALDPHQPEAWLNKAILNVRYGKSREALPLVAKALENRTRRPALAYFVRGVANEDSGNITAAYNDLRRAQALEPSWREPAIELKRYQVRRP